MNEIKKVTFTPKFFITISLICGLNIVLSSFRVVYSSLEFVRWINVVIIIIQSGIVGACIIQLLLLKEK